MRGFALLLAALCAATLVARAPLFDPDEGLHAAIAQEMLLRRDYVTPTFLGEPFLDKPILFFWAEAASLRLFGMNEAAVRIPPLLFGVLSALGVAALGVAMLGAHAGIRSGIVYATMLLPVSLSNVAVHDVALAPFECGAALALWRAIGSRRPWAWGLATGICLGLSILTKGLVGVAFTGLFALAVALWRGDALLRLVVALAIGGAVALIVAAPWYLAVERAHPGYLHYYFVERHLQGFMTATQRHSGRPWWYYVPIVIAGALPWTGYAAGALRDLRSSPTLKIVWTWFAAGVLFVSVAQSKLATYVVPAMPALAIAVGHYLEGVADSRSDRRGFLATSVAIQVMLMAALPLAGLAAVRWEFHDPSSPFAWIAAAVALAIIVVWATAAWKRSSAVLVDQLGWITATSVAILILVVAPRAAASMSAKDLAQAINAHPILPPRILVVDERIGSVVFYLSPDLRPQLTRDRIATASLSAIVSRLDVEHGDAIVAIRGRGLPRLTRLSKLPLVPDAVSGTFALFRVAHLRAALR